MDTSRGIGETGNGFGRGSVTADTEGDGDGDGDGFDTGSKYGVIGVGIWATVMDGGKADWKHQMSWSVPGWSSCRAAEMSEISSGSGCFSSGLGTGLLGLLGLLWEACD